MPADLLVEDVVSMAEATRIFPTHPHISTLWRWHRRGNRGIRLETVVIGGKRYTSREAIRRFVERTTEAHEKRAAAPASPGAAPTRRKRQAAVTEARKKLQEASV